MVTYPDSVRLLEQRLKQNACVSCGTPQRRRDMGQRVRCHACGGRYRPARLERELQILRYFCLEISAHRVARELHMSFPPIWQRFMAYRRWMAMLAETEARPLTGELECDESYFGGRRRGRARGRARGHKVVVFGILERQGRVSTVVVPQADEATLMQEIQQRALKGAVFYTDRFRSYQSLKRYGKHLPVDHSVEYVRPGRRYQRHINGIEGFWSYAKERFRKYHGVTRRYFPLYLKEMEFRFNHRRDDLFELVGTQLVRVLFAYPVRYPL